MASLTNREKHLLHYPPTEKTWTCGRVVATTEGVKLRCGVANSSSQVTCWCCGYKKPTKPTLLWPSYTKACEKAKIEPGTPWPVKDAKPPVPTTAPQKRRRKRG